MYTLAHALARTHTRNELFEWAEGWETCSELQSQTLLATVWNSKQFALPLKTLSPLLWEQQRWQLLLHPHSDFRIMTENTAGLCVQSSKVSQQLLKRSSTAAPAWRALNIYTPLHKCNVTHLYVPSCQGSQIRQAHWKSQWSGQRQVNYIYISFTN